MVRWSGGQVVRHKCSTIKAETNYLEPGCGQLGEEAASNGGEVGFIDDAQTLLLLEILLLFLSYQFFVHAATFTKDYNG